MFSKENAVEKISAHHLHEISRMLHADGVAVLQSGKLVAGGVCPSAQEIRSLAAWIVAHPGDGVISTNHLAELYPPAERFRGRGSGLLGLTVSAEVPWLVLWFRAEQIETINWAGNPHELDASDPAAPLGPRASFDAWRETVHGQARPWTAAEVDSATRLRSALMEVRQTWQMHALNRHLTGSCAIRTYCSSRRNRSCRKSITGCKTV
jgi:light-regulated signal transduction histidine kinase (bacteriophytochrome)